MCQCYRTPHCSELWLWLAFVLELFPDLMFGSCLEKQFNPESFISPMKECLVSFVPSPSSISWGRQQIALPLALGPVLDRAPQGRVIYSRDAAAMCHDVGAPLAAGALFYRDRAIGPLRRGRWEKGLCVKIWGKKRAREGWQTQTGDMLIQRDWKKENEGAGEKMGRDKDRWGESQQWKEREKDMSSDRQRGGRNGNPQRESASLSLSLHPSAGSPAVKRKSFWCI